LQIKDFVYLQIDNNGILYRMKRIFVYIIIVLGSFINFLFAQNTKSDKVIQKATELIRQNKEDKAIEILQKATNEDIAYPPLYIFLGEIYFHQKDLDNSIANYKKVIEINKDYDLGVYYRLAIMQKQTKDYISSKQNFKYYIDNQTNSKYESIIYDCKYNIECIDFILEQQNKTTEFNPINLGENINDTAYQYLPTLTLDNQLYLTQRENNTEDFYFSRIKNIDTINNEGLSFDKWWYKKEKLSSVLNTSANEGAASISPDGRYLYFAKCNTKDGYGSCDIYRSKRNGDKWSKPENLGPAVNSKYWDSQPSIASDGRTLFFASNREGGFGGSDIWYSYLKDDGSWTKAKNCGKVINTGGDEISPFMHPSNTTLYFASDSLIGMGGQDIYYSKILNGKFQQPINMGYPINTDKDETCLVVSSNGEFAIYAKDNPPNNMDLYAFYLEKSLCPTKVICLKGKVLYDDNKQGNEAIFEIRNLKNNKLITSTISDKFTDEYSLAIVVGEDYAMSVTCEGYLLYSENFSTKEDTSFANQNYILKDISMQSLKEGKVVILENIFFATNSFELSKESEVELNTLFKLLNDNPNIKIEISGHTDNTGDSQYNLILSKNRANSVKQWLLDKGIKDNRIIAKGYGDSKPNYDNSTAEGKAKNRRTEFKILSTNN